MTGLWQWVDHCAVTLCSSFGNTQEEPKALQTAPKGEFTVGTALPFGEGSDPEGTEITIPLELLTKHGALFGASGCGKTTFIHRLREAFVEAGINCIDLDFRGDTFDLALMRLFAAGVPPSRITAIDLRASDRLFPLNLLGYGLGDFHSRASIIYEALKDQSPSWGVLLGQDLRGALTALAECHGSLVDVGRVLSPEGADFRSELISAVTDSYALEFLESFAALPPEVQRQRAGAVTNKLDEYLSHPTLRACLSASSAPDMRQIMDEPGHITLIALGADRNPQAALIGRMVIAAVQRAALARVDVPETKRNPCRLIVDEAQNLLGEQACEILAEGRRFRLGLILCSQFAGTLPTQLRASVKVNCSFQLYFQTSAAEASDIATEVVCSLSRDEIRKVVITSPVGSAVMIKRGEQARYVSTPNASHPQVDGGGFDAYRKEVIARTTLSKADAALRPATNPTAGKAQTKQEVVTHVRKPFKRK